VLALRLMSEPSVAAAIRADAFFTAARAGDVTAMQHALGRDGLTVNSREAGSGMTPLMCAVGWRQREATEWLLANGADVNAAVTGYGSPLAFAAGGQDGKEMLALLLAHGADPNVCAWDGVTPLIQAAMWDNPDAAEMLLRAGARPDVRTYSGNTARSIAESNGYTRIVRLLDDARDQRATRERPTR